MGPSVSNLAVKQVLRHFPSDKMQSNHPPILIVITINRNEREVPFEYEETEAPAAASVRRLNQFTK